MLVRSFSKDTEMNEWLTGVFCPVNTWHTYPRHDILLVNPPPLTSWLVHIISHMSKWLVEACCSPLCLIGLALAGLWRETQDEPFVWVIGGIKTAHTRHRGYWWNGDSPDEEQFLFFCSEAKTSQASIHCVVRCPHGDRSATEHEFAESEIGQASLSALSQCELHCLWYQCADVSLVSSCQGEFKGPSGLWQKLKYELHGIALEGMMQI